MDNLPEVPAQDAEKIRRLMNWWNEARDYAVDNRMEMATDEDFVDGIQWTPEEKQILEQRGQMPLVFNEIRIAVQWIIGTEKRTRIDWSVLPREENDEQGAQIKTQVLKYLADVNRFSFERSIAFEEAVRAGCGWLETGVRHSDEEPIYITSETWRNIWLDPMSRALDLSDARYLIRSKVIDLDLAQSMFPQVAERLRWESEHFDRLTWQNRDIEFDSRSDRMHHSFLAGDNSFQRPVVRIIECWYRDLARVSVLRGTSFNGQILNSSSAAHQQAIQSGRVEVLEDVPRLQMRVALFTMGGYLMLDEATPYIHNRFPFIPVWGYRYARDRQPYGAPRQTRDPQIDLNKRRSKALFALSTNKVIADKGAVDDMEAFEEEAGRPDQVVWVNPGKTVNFINNLALADAHVNMGLQDGEFIRQLSGVTAENLGLDSNAQSGKAIIAKQNQGSVVTATLFDNLRLATQLSGELMLSLVEQFYDSERTIRIVGDKQKVQFTPINRALPDGTILNDVTARQGDFRVSEQDYRESYRQAMFEVTMQTLSRLPPDISIKLLDLVYEFSDLPNKEEIVKRIRQVNGALDPDDPNAQQQAQAAQQQTMAAQQQAQQQQAEKVAAETALKQAQAAKAEAEADKTMVETRLLTLPSPVPMRAASQFSSPKEDFYGNS